MSLSSGLVEETEPVSTASTAPTTLSGGASASSALGEPTDQTPSSAAASIASLDPLPDDDADLLGLDLGINPGGFNLGDFADLEMDTDGTDEQQPSSAEVSLASGR